MGFDISKGFLLFLAAISFFGLALVLLLLLQPNLQADQLVFRRPLISTVYIVVCVEGIVAVFYPGKCRMMFQKPSVYPDSKKTSSDFQVKGHHPVCEKFSPNRLSIRRRVFCAACSGLLVGAIAAIAVVILFTLGFLDFGSGSLWAFVIGAVLMLGGVAQIKMGGYIKMVLNTLFVVGSGICLVSADLVGQSLFVDAYMLGVIVFLLLFRILLSEWNNKRTCVACGRCL